MRFSPVSSHRVACRKCGKLSPFDAGCPCENEGCAPGEGMGAAGWCIVGIVVFVVGAVIYALVKGIPHA